MKSHNNLESETKKPFMPLSLLLISRSDSVEKLEATPFGNEEKIWSAPLIGSGASMTTQETRNSTGEQHRTRILQGMTPSEAINQYESELTPYEKSELSRFSYIYTVGSVRVESRS